LKVSKQNNDIRLLFKPSQVRLVNLDLDSPRMTQAMQVLGFEKEDLNTRKRRDQFIVDTDTGTGSSPSTKAAVNVKNLNTIETEEVDEALV